MMGETRREITVLAGSALFSATQELYMKPNKDFFLGGDTTEERKINSHTVESLHACLCVS